jgi:uroporphyrinogen-III synthase
MAGAGTPPGGSGAAGAEPAGPLAGRTIVVTRARAQAAALAQRLEALGAEVLAFPVIRIEDPEDWGPADAAIGRLGTYDWIVFTSANAVARFFERVTALGGDTEASLGGLVAAIGPGTAERLRARGVEPDLIPERAVAEGLLEAFEGRGVGPGTRVLLPRALEARETLPETLRAAGVHVDVVPVYRTVRGKADPDVLSRMASGVDAVTFTSASTVRHFLALVQGTAAEKVLDGALVASIGPVTSDELRGAGVRVDVEADPHTVPGLAAGLAGRLRGSEG